jgi:3-methyladenine DNA glycosylase/8-oxoguanine DNA glycosylase
MSREQMDHEESIVAHTRVGIFPVHFRRTFSLHRMGPYDPTVHVSDDCFRKAFWFKGLPTAVEICRDGDALRVRAFGEHCDALLAETLRGLNQSDQYAEFSTDDTGILRLHRRLTGLRILRVPWVYETTCSVILQQRIRTVDAFRDWRRLTQRFGSDAPLGLRVFPAAEVMARVPQHELERMGIDQKRVRALLRFANEMRFVKVDTGTSFADLRRRLWAIAGIGGWTVESVLGINGGDVDAAIPGDLHLPRVVCYALAGEMQWSDERMMELLEPFRGHRYRVIRLISASGLDLPW